MGQDIGFSIDGDRKVGVRFDEFPKQAHDGILRRITRLTSVLEAKVVAKAPGKIKGKIKAKVYDDKNRISGRVSVTGDFAKAGALEYGAHRATKVKEHSQRLDHFWSVKLQEPTKVIVSAYSRTPNIEEVRYLRGPIAEIGPEAVSEIQEEITGLSEAD